MGRQEAGLLRAHVLKEGWLTPGAKLPDDAALTAVFDAPKRQAAGPASSLEAHHKLIKEWVEQTGQRSRDSPCAD